MVLGDLIRNKKGNKKRASFLLAFMTIINFKILKTSLNTDKKLQLPFSFPRKIEKKEKLLAIPLD